MQSQLWFHDFCNDYCLNSTFQEYALYMYAYICEILTFTKENHTIDLRRNIYVAFKLSYISSANTSITPEIYWYFWNRSCSVVLPDLIEFIIINYQSASLFCRNILCFCGIFRQRFRRISSLPLERLPCEGNDKDIFPEILLK